MAEYGSQAAPGSVVAAGWHKSSYSAYNGNCVEVARLKTGEIGVRDSKEGAHGTVLRFDRAAWLGFLASLKTTVR